MIRDQIDIERRAFEVAEELARSADFPPDEEQRLFRPIRDAMFEAFEGGGKARSLRGRV